MSPYAIILRNKYGGVSMAGFFDLLSELIKSKKDKHDSSVVVKNYISGNNNQNNKQNNNNGSNGKNTNTQQLRQSTESNKINGAANPIVLQTIKLYCTGAKGKVYTTTFHKAITHNFGIEVVIKNNTSITQTVNLGHCIYDESGNNTMFKGNFHPQIKPNTVLKYDIYVDAKAFAKMKPGKYKSQFWINNKKVQKVFFTVSSK